MYISPERFRWLAIAALGLAMASTNLQAQTTVTVTVPGTANPYLAGMPDGTTCCDGDVAPAESPVLVSGITLVAGRTLTFSATGGVDNTGAPPQFGPDGNVPPAFLTAGVADGIADANAPVNSLVGVFLGASQPSLFPAPSATDFYQGLNYQGTSPGLRQIFFIGDGVTGQGGTVQQVVIPPGATRLFLADWDGYNWANNSGAFTVNVTAQ